MSRPSRWVDSRFQLGGFAGSGGCLQRSMHPPASHFLGGVRASHENVPLFPLATHLVGCGGYIKMFRFGSTIRFPTQSETISFGLLSGGNVSLFLKAPPFQTPRTYPFEEVRARSGAGRALALHDLRPVPETCVQHRYRDLLGPRWCGAAHRLHRRPDSDRENSQPPRQEEHVGRS